MLKNILSPDTCAECRICCIFDKYDIWETPVVSGALKDKITAEHSDIRFIFKGDSKDSFLFVCRNETIGGEDLYVCPALDHGKGCVLDDNKPFDCRIWPYRIMEFEGRQAITVASICPDMYSKPLKSLIDELKNGLADEIFDYADKNPDIVKPYQDGYPILLVRQ